PSSPATSVASAKVLMAAPANTAQPTITGTAKQGQTLSEVHGSWTNNPTSYAYQWQQCDSSGSSCAAIFGATSQTYVLVSSDVGHALRVQEIATNEAGSGNTDTSGASATVLPSQPTNSAPPTITSTAKQSTTLT